MKGSFSMGKCEIAKNLLHLLLYVRYFPMSDAIWLYMSMKNDNKKYIIQWDLGVFSNTQFQDFSAIYQICQSTKPIENNSYNPQNEFNQTYLPLSYTSDLRWGRIKLHAYIQDNIDFLIFESFVNKRTLFSKLECNIAQITKKNIVRINRGALIAHLFENALKVYAIDVFEIDC